MATEAKHYADRNIIALDKAGGYYSRHVMALTREDLHSKSDIAAELAWRDAEIDRLKAVLAKAIAPKAEPAMSTWERLLQLANEESNDAAASVQHGAESIDIPEWAHLVIALAASAPALQDEKVGIGYDDLVLAFCANWSGNDKVEAGIVLDWLMRQPRVKLASPTKEAE